MKSLLFTALMLVSFVSYGQHKNSTSNHQKTVLENDKLKVVEYVSEPQGDVCGIGIHKHDPHLTVLLSDVKVTITAQDGKTKKIEAPKGTSFWSGFETHSVINNGLNPTKMLLIFLKE